MNGPGIIIGTATSGGGVIMIAVVVALIALVLTVRWVMQRRGG
jgi:hypothetical protein